jgi:hypothetical protein
MEEGLAGYDDKKFEAFLKLRKVDLKSWRSGR